MRLINKIVVHCSASAANNLIDVRTIRRWHLARGWSDIGYHYVIKTNGTIESGRPLVRAGAHARGHNKNSIGICLIGGVGADKKPVDNFTTSQFESLKVLLKDLSSKFPKAEILGHRDLYGDTNNDGVIDKKDWLKECPCFDVKEFLKVEAL